MEKILYNYGRLEWKAGAIYGISFGVGIGCTLTYILMKQLCYCSF